MLGLLHADDLLLMAQSDEEMTTLLKITTEVGNQKGLQFNPSKSAVVIFNTSRLGAPKDMVIQDKHIDFQDSYKYLGITLCDAPNYLDYQERTWKRETNDCTPKACGRELSTDVKSLESNGKRQGYRS